MRKSQNACASPAGWYLVFAGEVLGGSILEYPAEHPKISGFGVDGVYFVAGVIQLLRWKEWRERRSLIWKQE